MCIEDIFRLYSDIKPSEYDIENIRNQEADFREVAFVKWGDRKIVVKLACNDFTTPYKIKGWLDTIDQYRKLGYDCPRIIQNKAGNLCETVSYKEKDCVLWAEEYSKYQTADKFEKSFIKNGNTYKYHDEIMKLIGTIASKHLDHVNWPSAWCILEPFCRSDDPNGETMECAKNFRDYIKNELSCYSERFSRIWSLYNQNKKELEKVYQKLPESVFQADLNPTNILLDESAHFMGLIDFNLSGREKVLNYVLMEAFWNFSEDAYCLENEEHKRYYESALNHKFDEALIRNLRLVGETYTFSQIEKEAAILLYHYLRPFSDPVLEEMKNVKNDSKKSSMLLDWIENEITRDDLDFESILQ